MFSNKEDAQKYIDEVGVEIKKRMQEALKTENLQEFSQKMAELEKYRDEVLHGKKYEEAENMTNPKLIKKVDSNMPSLSSGSFIADMNKLSSIENENSQTDYSSKKETQIDYSFLLK